METGISRIKNETIKRLLWQRYIENPSVLHNSNINNILFYAFFIPKDFKELYQLCT